MEQKSELAKILMVGAELLTADRSAKYLCDHVGVSRATVMRYLGELRHLGCQIVSRRDASGSLYRLENGAACADRLRRWLELELSRSVVSA